MVLEGNRLSPASHMKLTISPPYTNIQQQPAHVQPPVITHSASQAPNPNRQQQYLPSPSNAGPSNSGSWMIDSSMEYVPAVSGSSSPSVPGLPRQSMPSISYGHAEQAMADHLLHSGHPSHNPGVVSSVPRAGVPVMSSYSMEYFDNDTVPPMNFAYPSHGMPSQSVISSVVPPVNTHSLPPPYKLSIPDGNSPYASPVSATGPNFPNVPFPQQRVPNDSFGRPNPMQQGKNSQYPKSRDFPVESPTSWRRTWDMQWNFP
ncbi:MADS-box transcription factor pvg4 [Schizosaccharomyces japonicus yFS275]|uniref:MADS-box transcription factor pvg4 n=1 Tax=Schizosaccharomyces japonicus (strain yFS275 / FY16936) TaxID=402676 RepID=B6K663_SCHJY|nr:MADS-box transcription factor pvg4 [Schizosaccharomyces japonicus yFS275]EEB09017.2 MADS-box transcription factor pvg4 [Schizosaccharomyces japonicus yFS275]